MTNRILKHWILPLFLFLFFLLSLLFLFGYQTQERRFRMFTSDFFKQEMASNTLNMHYTLSDPSSYGIYSYKPSLPLYSAKQQLQSSSLLENYLYRLNQIDSKRLSDSYTYDLLVSYLQNELVGADFEYYAEPFSPSHGMQSQLPILFAEYRFETKKDVKDYLTLLSQTGFYFDSLLSYESEKANAGLFMADYAAQSVALQCQSIINEEVLLAQKHFLQVTFQERLDSLCNDSVISKKEADEFSKINHNLLLTVVLPAYEKVSSSLSSLKGSGTNSEGLCHYAKGRDYYQYLIRQNCGSFRNIEDIKALLYPQFEYEYDFLQNALSQERLRTDNLNNALQPMLFPLKDASAMLSHLQTRILADFPPFPLVSENQALPACNVKTISPSLEDYSSPAFYLTPPIDDSMNNVIYINEKDSPQGLNLYTTLAHEGYPGHLYQTVYHHLYHELSQEDPVRHLLGYAGYQEGWALYTELLSFDYASELMLENGYKDCAYAYQLEKHNRSLQLCLYSILDIAIHYEGASLQQVTDILDSFGITDKNSIQNIYNYITCEPANYLKYYLGYLEILELKKTAKSLWKENYSDYRFHEFYLQSGPSDFYNLGKKLTSSAAS